MQLNKCVLNFAVSLGMLIFVVQETEARAPRLPSNPSSSSSSSSSQDAGSRPGAKLTKSDGTVQILTVAELEKMGPIYNADGSLWMNGPGTFPGPGSSKGALRFSNPVPPPVAANDNVATGNNNAAAAAISEAAAVPAAPAAPASPPAAANANAYFPTPAPASARPPSAPPAAPAANANQPQEAAATPAAAPRPPADIPPPSTNQDICFTDLASYISVKDKLRDPFRSLPLVFSKEVGFLGKGAVKISDHNGKLRFQMATSQIGSPTLTDEQMIKKVCFKADGMTATMISEKDKQYDIAIINATNVKLSFIDDKGQRASHDLPIGNESSWKSIAGSIIQQEIRDGKTPKFGVQ